MEMSGLAPPATVISPAISPGGFWPTSQRRNSSGSATVADRPIGLQLGHIVAQPRQTERQQVPALRDHQRMQFVEHDVAQILEEAPGIGRRDQQRQLLGRGQQDVGRHQLLPLALVRGRVAGARLDGDGQADLFHWLAEIALDVDGQRLQRRDVKRVDAAMRLARFSPGTVGEFGQRRHEAGQRLAGAGRRDQQHRLPGLGPRQQLDLVGARRPAFFARTI